MGAFGSRNSVAVIPGVVMGSFLCLGLLLLAFAAMIVLSLISIYIPNHAVKAHGEQYRIKTIVLKTLYQGDPFTFLNGTIANSDAVSTLCGTVYRRLGVKNFVGCVTKNFRAFNANKVPANFRRRRTARATNPEMYEIGEMNLYYSVSCGKKSDKLKYANEKSLSSCVKRRLAACNSFANNSASPIPWEPLPTPLTQSIFDTKRNTFQTITVERLFGIPYTMVSSLAANLLLPPETVAEIQLGCQYIGPLSQADINEALLAQQNQATTQPSPLDSTPLSQEETTQGALTEQNQATTESPPLDSTTLSQADTTQGALTEQNQATTESPPLDSTTLSQTATTQVVSTQ